MSKSVVNNKNKFPKTRYQGSKYKLLPWIKENIVNLEFNSALDAFSGTSSVAYMLKDLGKQVYTNDIMQCNYFVAKALIENSSTLLSNADIQFLLEKDSGFKYDRFIENNFKDIYYTDEENKWLDIVVQNILRVEDEYKKSMAFWALYQSCIIKRPYNLFHRKNLHIRTAEIERSFGNKTTWDKPFEHFFKQFIKEANDAVFNNSKRNKAICGNILDLNEKNFDLVYIDPPYIPKKGSLTLYQDFYHFLNGISDYYNWSSKIDYKSKNLKLKSEYSVWEDKKEILNGFKNLFTKFKASIIVVSYCDDGIPSIDELKEILESLNKNVEIKSVDYKYALANSSSKEVLIIAR